MLPWLVTAALQVPLPSPVHPAPDGSLRATWRAGAAQGLEQRRPRLRSAPGLAVFPQVPLPSPPACGLESSVSPSQLPAPAGVWVEL